MPGAPPCTPNQEARARVLAVQVSFPPFLAPSTSLHAPFVLSVSTKACCGKVASPESAVGPLLDKAVVPAHVRFLVRCIDVVPRPGLPPGVEEDDIVDVPVNPSTLLCVAVSARPLPDDLAPVVVRPKHGVHHKLQVVTCGGVTVKIDTPSRLQHAVELPPDAALPSPGTPSCRFWPKNVLNARANRRAFGDRSRPRADRRTLSRSPSARYLRMP